MLKGYLNGLLAVVLANLISAFRVSDFVAKADVGRLPSPTAVDQQRIPSAVWEFFERLGPAVADCQDIVPVVTRDGVFIARASPDGPDITISISAGRFALAIGGWHDDFESSEVVFEYVRRAVKGTLRVRQDFLRDKPWRFAVEWLEQDGLWSEKDVLEFPRLAALWGGAISIRYLQNGLRRPPR